MLSSAKTQAGNQSALSEHLHVFLNVIIWLYMLLAAHFPFSSSLV